jgi:amino acid adenylation domain-containing protein/non-ribosomal peptide synthase protein (TIGR01720 family)
MTDLAKTLAKLSPEKRKLLELKLKQKGAKFNSFPLSFAQQRMWFLDQMEPGSPVYNIPVAWKISGDFDIAIFKKTLDAIITRHEILRTNFVTIAGKGMQVISQKSQISIETLEISSATAAGKEKIEKLVRDKFRTSFDLQKGPLGAVTLIKTNPNEYILVFVLHHIISDGWSMGVLINEFQHYYQSIRAGKNSALPPLKIQYADFAQWQHKWLKGERYEKQLAYWKKQIDPDAPVLNLPTDKPRPAVLGNNGAQEKYTFPKELSVKLNALSKKEGTTNFMTLLAAFNILLSKYARQKDISVGIPIANRNRAELEGLIGFFVNTLVIRSDLSGKLTFIGYLNRLKETSLNAFANQDLPFENLVEALQPERDMGHTPLFQVFFVMQNAVKNQAGASSDIHIEELEVQNNVAQFDLTLTMVELDEQLGAGFEYNTDLFKKETISRMFGHLHRILEAIVENPEIVLDDISLLDSAEHKKIIYDWNQTNYKLPTDTVLKYIEEQVKKTPQAIAVIDGPNKFTYLELDEKSNQLAHFLINRGIQTEDVIGLSIDRSFEMIVALLGILKSGAAYLPLDPNYPEERLSFMMADASIKILITREKLKERFKQDFIKPVCLDSDWPAIEKENKNTVDVEISPLNRAYIIYTSGSTGTPKGVDIYHQSVLNHNRAVIKDFSLSASDKVLQFATINFDAAVEEIFPVLQTGGRLILRGTDVLISAKELLRLIEREQLTVLDLPTAYWHQFVNEIKELSAPIPQSLRLVVLGGDKISAEHFVSWNKLGGTNIELINSYGPTETTIISTLYKTTDADKERSEPEDVPIGRPIFNTSAYILDENLHPVPVGAPGELHIGGLGLARGYLNQPTLTAEKFIPDPFSTKPDARMYKTGDLVSFRADGQIDFVGRVDNQLKIRGFRVELGEIESALEKHPVINEAVVIVKTFDNNDKRLIAFFVATGSDIPSQSAIKDFLSDHLPEYMVPAQFKALENLPLTPNGKINKKALQKLDFNFEDARKEFKAPSTTTEEIMARVFCEVLHVDKISVLDNFFDLGGHSLLATQVTSRVRDKLEVEIPLRFLFEAPTVESISVKIDTEKLQSQAVALPPITKLEKGDNLKLSFSQQRLWFLDQMDPGNASYNIPVAFKAHGKLDIEAFTKTIVEVIRRQESLRTSIITENGQPKLGIATDVEAPIFIEDISSDPKNDLGDTIQKRVFEEARFSFKLDQAPLFRVVILLVSESQSIILVNMHHIISDGWSVNIIFYEISQIYASYTQGSKPTLPDLNFQYADYASWQQSWLQGNVLEEHLSYWRTKLSGAPALLNLPTDRPRQAVQTVNGAHIGFELPQELAAKLNTLSRKEGVTLFMVVMAAFKVLLSRYAGQNDISIGTPIANRTRSEIENIVGFFVNTLVMRTQINPSASFLSLVKDVRKTAFEAYAHQDLPFEKIVDAVDPARDTSYSPLFQVMFTMQNNPQKEVQTADVTLEALEIENNISKFDLSLSLAEEGKNISGAMEFNTDLFDRSTIERMITYFKGLLISLVEHPEIPLSKIWLITDDEETHLLKSLNNFSDEQTFKTNIKEIFEKQAAQFPDAVALEWMDTESEDSKNDQEESNNIPNAPGKIVSKQAMQLTYAELNARANQLAHTLRDQGIQNDDLVGLYFERSPEMIISILAVIKSGAAYVPIDPAYPQERVDYMIEDSGMKVLLTHAPVILNGAQQSEESPEKVDGILRSVNFTQNDIKVIFIDAPESFSQNGTNPKVTIDPDNLVYMIYTSGSTGKPKGTLITHAGLTHYLNWAYEAYPLNEGRGSLVHSTIAFDATVTAVFTPILTGKTITLAATNDDLDALANALLHYKNFNTVKITPAHLDLLSQQIPADKAAGLTKAFVIGGENLVDKQIAFWQKNAPDTALFNEYGPTETVVGCIVYNAKSWEGKGSVPIGRSITNSPVYILDEHLQPVPKGIPGELYIGGKGVARGYKNRADLTADKFMPDPFAKEAGARMYKTGDLVCYLNDDQMIFLDRIDSQVKIRGYRIELGEIENVLIQHKNIKEAVVNVHITGSKDKQLAAYIVAREGKKTDIDVLRKFLSERLPGYMIPAYFVYLENLPLTSNGKIDRNRLPEPTISRDDIKSKYEAPRTEQEEILVSIVEELLNIDKFGIHDNFFELGGDSIMSIQVIARAKQKGLQLTPLQMFQNQTVAKLASVARQVAVVEAEQGLVTGKSQLTPVQKLFFESDFKEAHHWNQSVIMQTRDPLKRPILEKTLHALLAHHDVLRSHFEKDKDEIVQLFDENINIGPSLAWVDLRGTATEHLSKRISEEANKLQSSLDLFSGPLLKLVYFDCGDQPHRLIMIIHHLVMDGVSWRILMEDFQMAYELIKNGKEAELPAKSTSFKEWSGSLADYVTTEKIQSQKDYWKTISEKPAPLLFKDFPNGENLENSGDNISVVLDEDQTKALLQDVPKTYNTQINDILLTALIKGFARWTGRRNLLVHLEGHGREHISDAIDISRTIGWFTTIYPAHLDLGKAVNPGDQIKAIKEQLNNIPDKGFGFGLLRYLDADLSFRESLSKLDAISILFNYLGQFESVAKDESPLMPSADDKGRERSPNAHQLSLIDINGSISGGKLSMTFGFSSNQFRKENIQRFANGFITELSALIAHCKNPAAGSVTASDFKLSGLNNKKLGKVLGKLGKKK